MSEDGGGLRPLDLLGAGANLVGEGTRATVVVTGYFGDRLAQMCERPRLILLLRGALESALAKQRRPVHALAG